MKITLRTTWYVCYLLIAALLSGCTTTPTNINLSAADQDRLHSIAVLDVSEPTEVSVTNMSALSGLALLGGLAQGAIDSSHKNTYAETLAGKGTVFAPTLASSVVDGLTGDGYQVIKLEGQKVEPILADKPEGYSNVHTDADAILNVWFLSAGYGSPPWGIDYVPLVVVSARLLDAKTKQDLFLKTYTCGFGKRPNGVHIDSEPAYHYATFGDIEENFDQSVNGIKSCEMSIAKAIAQGLRNGQ